MNAPQERTIYYRISQLLRLVASLTYAYLLVRVAQHGAAGLVSEVWQPLVSKAMLVFLLLLGFTVFGFIWQREDRPISAQGLPRRSGWRGEFGLGAAVGWTLAVIAVVPLAIFGGIVIRLHFDTSAWVGLVAELGFFLLATLAEEIVFRGYPFQCLVRAVGEFNATLLFSALFAMVISHIPGATGSAVIVGFVFNLLLTIGYLRTRALWVSWGLNFAWKASRALLFGLAIAGESHHSPVVVGDPLGPFWLTGGGFGLEASWSALLLFVVAIPVLNNLTQDLNFIYNAPVIEPGGVAVDISGAAAQQHDAAMSSPAAVAPAGATLVQIEGAPVATPKPIEPNL